MKYKLFNCPCGHGATSSDGGYIGNTKYPFYHSKPFELTDYQRDYVNDVLGVELNESLEFTDDEDNLLRKNFDRYVKKNKLKSEDVFVMIEYYIPGRTLVPTVNRALKFKKLWPHICCGLDNRTAWSIQQRLLVLFDPNYGNTSDDIDEMELQRRVYRGNCEEYCIQNKIPLSLIAIRIPVSGYSTNRYFLLHSALTRKILECSEEQYCSILFDRNSCEEISQYVKWDSLRKYVSLLDGDLKELWMKQAAEFTLDWDNESDVRNCLAKDPPVSNLIKNEYTMIVMKAIYNSTNDDVNEFTINSLNLEKFKYIILNYNDGSLLTTFHGCIEFRYVLKQFFEIDNIIFKHLSPKPTLKERAMIYHEAARRQQAASSKHSYISFSAPIVKVFIVAYEYYSLRYNFHPTDELAFLMEEVHLRLPRFDDKKYSKTQQDLNTELSCPISDHNKLKRKTPMKIKVHVVTTENIDKSPPRKRANIDNYDQDIDEGSSSQYDSEGDCSDVQPENSEISAELFDVNETVLAAGGGKTAKSMQANLDNDETMNDFREEISQIKAASDSLLISIPERQKTPEKEAETPILPTEPSDNWLDLLG